MKYLAHLLIRFYQKYLSRHKGFRCAHAALHGQDSCSEAVRKIILAKGLFGGWQDIRARFKDCGKAFAQLSEENEKKQEKHRKKGSRREYCKDAACEGGTECGFAGFRPSRMCDLDLPCSCWF